LKTVIGIKCTDGIVIASDSQATSKSQRTKTLGVSKIFQINDSSLLAGAADGGHIKILVEELKDQLSRYQTSIIRFIEDNWNLGRIGNQSFDVKAGSIKNMFNLTTGHYTNKLFLDPLTGIQK
jgi:hypothetical protein